MTLAATDKMLRNCLYCHEPFELKRQDKKFCTEACKTAYHNERRTQTLEETTNENVINPAFEKIYQILLKNRETLMYYDFYKEEPYLLRDLQGHGFNLKYFTSEYEMENVGTFKFCFDYGYHITSTGRVYIIERHDEVFC